ncbi:hypothetical protein HAX54_051466, partial [Datura stramonium]|nr:hypothetical protein [Datura stramonium]
WYQSRCRAGGGANLSEDAESLRGVTRDGDTEHLWYQSRCRAGGGANLSEDAESLRGITRDGDT